MVAASSLSLWARESASWSVGLRWALIALVSPRARLPACSPATRGSRRAWGRGAGSGPPLPALGAPIGSANRSLRSPPMAPCTSDHAEAKHRSPHPPDHRNQGSASVRARPRRSRLRLGEVDDLKKPIAQATHAIVSVVAVTHGPTELQERFVHGLEARGVGDQAGVGLGS